MAALKTHGLPIGDAEVYTGKTDPNEQLGRPGGYTSKANFHDTRLGHSDDFDTESGGSVEAFATVDDAKERYEQVDSITRGNAMLNEYHWQVGVAFLRVSKKLTPSQAAEYESAFRALIA